MSRTFRHSNKGNKNLNKYAVSRHFDYVYYKEQRKPNKIKGGAIIEDNEEFLVSVQNGHFQEVSLNHTEKLLTVSKKKKWNRHYYAKCEKKSLKRSAVKNSLKTQVTSTTKQKLPFGSFFSLFLK